MKRRPVAKRNPARRKAAALPERIGMGTLISLTVTLENGRQRTWNFRKYPVLAFDYVSDDASGRGRQAQLYVRCGNYRFTRDARLTVRPVKHQPQVSPSSVKPSIRRDFERTHGGISPGHAYVCAIPAVGRKRYLGRVVQMDYHANKKKHGPVQYYHPLEDHAQPQVWCNEAGTQLYFMGGRYTVTPHGIEDID